MDVSKEAFGSLDMCYRPDVGQILTTTVYQSEFRQVDAKAFGE